MKSKQNRTELNTVQPLSYRNKINNSEKMIASIAVFNILVLISYVCVCMPVWWLQDTKISEIMRPRVEVVAIEANSTMMDLYVLHQARQELFVRVAVQHGLATTSTCLSVQLLLVCTHLLLVCTATALRVDMAMSDKNIYEPFRVCPRYCLSGIGRSTLVVGRWHAWSPQQVKTIYF